MDPEESTAGSTATSPLPMKKPGFITQASALLTTLKRMKEANDNVAFRTTGGLRIMLRNDPDSEDESDDIAFDVSVVIGEDENPSIVKAIKNEIDIMEDEAGMVVIEDYAFSETDNESLKNCMDFLNAVDLWTVCPCGEYLIKDKHENQGVTMCYYCEMTANGDGSSIFCPICHESGSARWMIGTTCCKQKMHKKCKEACIASDGIRLVDSRCPMCREPW